MDVLDSPIDALVFDYLNLGISSIINSLWTWVAVITAAVSFWRIRAAGAGHGAVKTLEEPSPSSAYIERKNTEPSQPETATSSSTTTAAPKSVTEPAAPGSVSSSPSVFEDNGVKKGKLVVYFYQDDDRQNDGNIDDGGEEELTVFGECGGELTLWERMLRVRMGDYGWYRCQDLTVINGNVVRLWDGERNSSDCVAWLRFHLIKLRRIPGYVCRFSYINYAIRKCFNKMGSFFVSIFAVCGLVPFFKTYLASRRTFILLFAMISSLEFASLISLLKYLGFAFRFVEEVLTACTCIVING